MLRGTASKVMWVERASRAPLYALGVVAAVIAALMIGALTARAAHAETFTVDRTNDTTTYPPSNSCTSAANDCTLRWALYKANYNGQTDTIRFASGLSGTITLIHSSLEILNVTSNPNLTIVGPASGAITVSGNDASRVFYINPGADATLKSLKIRNGQGDTAGGGIFNDGTLALINTTVSDSTLTSSGNNYGGGIYNRGTLSLTNSTVSNNSATNGISGSLGGGIWNEGGTLTLTKSTVSGNETFSGGGIANWDGGTLKMTDSTISGNEAVGDGGGIHNYNSTLELTNSTVSGNYATGSTGGGIAAFSSGTTPTPALLNTIVAGNTAASGPDVSGTFGSQGNNLIGNTSGSSGWSTSDLQNVDPLLGPLQNNGGSTLTHALLQGSPAIDRGANTGCPAIDQRGKLRQDGDADGTVTCDIGAFEAANTKPTITNLKPAPGSETRDRTPFIAATVRDLQTNLAKTNIELFVDGNKKTTFSYDRSTDRLSYTSGQLALGRHTVKIVATEGVNTTTKSWSFEVVG